MNPANTTGNGNSVLYCGSLATPHVLQVFLEVRDPGSARTADALLGTIRQAADDGTFVAQFHFTANIDDEVGGGGSRRALGALGAAADVGQSEFVEFLGTLFSLQPQFVTDDPFVDPSFLLDAASKVKGLRSPQFDRKVTGNAYADWAANAVADFQQTGVVGTPTIWFDQRVVLGLPVDTTLTPQQFLAEIAK
jgi:predicted DsbA family dithiol-disulfide isomerase